MLCSSCKRREPIDGFKTCPDCRKAKRRYYHQKKERKIQDEINRYDAYDDFSDYSDLFEKINYRIENILYSVEKINENTNIQEHIDNIKKIINFFDMYYERDLYINKLLNSIKNDKILKELKEH